MALLRLFLLSNIGPTRLGGWAGAGDVLAEGGRGAEEFLEGMAVSELLDYLHGRNINTSACVRKSELVALARRVAASARPAAAAAAPARPRSSSRAPIEGISDTVGYARTPGRARPHASLSFWRRERGVAEWYCAPPSIRRGAFSQLSSLSLLSPPPVAHISWQQRCRRRRARLRQRPSQSRWGRRCTRSIKCSYCRFAS